MTFDESAVGDFLEHYGVKRRSGRYKYGSGKRPFQGESRSLIEEFRDAYNEGLKIYETRKAKEKKEAAAKKAEQKKKRKEKEAAEAEREKKRKEEESVKREAKEKADAERKEKEAAKREEKRQAVIQKKRQAILRDPKELRRHQYEFTSDEIREALQRFEWDKSMSQYSQAKIQAGRNYVENAAKIAESGIKLWNTVASTYNSFNKYGKDDTNAMPSIIPPKTDSGTSKEQVKKWFKEFQKEGS